MSDDKNKNIPTLEDIIHPGDLNKAVVGELNEERDDIAGATSDTQPADHTGTEEHVDEQAGEQTDDNRQVEDRRMADRRESSEPLPDDMTERRVAQRRGSHRRETDKQRNINLNLLVEKIMHDMMPDLEQHFRLQLRFELEKHLPHSTFENNGKD